MGSGGGRVGWRQESDGGPPLAGSETYHLLLWHGARAGVKSGGGPLPGRAWDSARERTVRAGSLSSPLRR
jgi:hypothetical protein